MISQSSILEILSLDIDYWVSLSNMSLLIGKNLKFEFLEEPVVVRDFIQAKGMLATELLGFAVAIWPEALPAVNNGSASVKFISIAQQMIL